MKKRIFNYFIIILYVLLLVIILKGEHFYGSQIDWINQHTAIPDFFRNYFYETKNLIPNYIFNIGAGQNIFNFSFIYITFYKNGKLYSICKYFNIHIYWNYFL